MTITLAMRTSDKPKWYQAIKKEHKKMVVMYLSKAVSKIRSAYEANQYI